MESLILGGLLAGALLTIALLWRRLHILSGKLREERKLAVAFHTSPDGISLTTIPEGRFVEVNEAFTRNTGWSREEALGRTAIELDLWPDPEDRQRAYSTVTEDSQLRDREIRFRRRDGEIRWGLLFAEIIEIEGQKVYFAMVRDNTSQKLAAEALRTSEQKFASAFHASPDSILLTTIPEGTILEANEGWTRITGVDRDQAIGHTTLDLGVWVDSTQREEVFKELDATGRVHFKEILIHRRDRSRRLCLLSAEPITLDGRPTLVSVVRDVTELRRSEAAREAMITELEAKNAELERFTYTVSHDLKSPLVTIRGFLGMLERDAVAGDLKRFREDSAHIHTATDHMCQLLDELLELARVGHRIGTLTEVNLAELARDTAEQLADELRGVEVEIMDELPTVTVDRLRLLEVFQNLISNAAKFFGDQPSPCIVVGCRKQMISEDGEETVIFVRDNGSGIAPQYHDQVFGLFNRLAPEVPGTGVGLALVKRIVEVHRGRIWVESDGATNGSTFCFTLGS